MGKYGMQPRGKTMFWVNVIIPPLVLLSALLLLGGCGALTGIPAHGGGKRFAVEQELVAATARATLKQLDLSRIQGKKVNIYMNAIGDIGVGNMFGGRFSLVSQLRGNYLQTPPVTERSTYQRFLTTTTNETASSTTSDASNDITGIEQSSSSSSSSGTSTTDAVLASPSVIETMQQGSGRDVQLGIDYKGLGAYQNSDRISSDDLQYLFGLMQTYFFLKGANVVPPSEAEVDVYVIVDVFGTIRTRIDWFLANNEILQAKTSLEVMAVDHQTGKLLMPPQSVVSEAEYNEQYLLWMGPVIVKKFLQESEPLLSDFTDLRPNVDSIAAYPEQDAPIPYPFRYQIEKWFHED